jgi:hypothetical protein
MANKWIIHVKKTMRTMKSRGTYKKGMGLKQVIVEAKKTWSKVKKGGADEMEEDSKVEDPVPVSGVEGGRRRRRNKTQKRSRRH